MVTRTEQLNLRLTDDEVRDMRDAAAEAGLTLSEWARLILRHASGRHEMSEHMERAADAGVKLFSAALGEAMGSDRPKRRKSR